MNTHFLNLEGATPYQQSIHQAILDTLGDPRLQPMRYHAETLNPETDEALRKDLMRHTALQAMMQKVDPKKVTEDIVKLLKDFFGEMLVTQKLKKYSAPIKHEAIFDIAYEIASSVPESMAQYILKEKSKAHHFRYNPHANGIGELAELLDSSLNAVIVRHLMGGLNEAITQGEITSEMCTDVTDHIIKDVEQHTNPTHIAALKRTIQTLSRENPGKPIIYLSIGCGDGRADAAIISALKTQLPNVPLHAIGFDPFQTNPQQNHIVTELGGHIINRELTPGETFLSVARKISGIEDPVVVATERFALHHMGRSTSQIKQEIEGATLISVEEPVSSIQRTDLAHRLAASGYDILANHAFEMRFGGGWISKARENPELFGSLYRRLEDMEASEGMQLEKVPGIYPATFVITYPPEKMLSTQPDENITLNGIRQVSGVKTQRA